MGCWGQSFGGMGFGACRIRGWCQPGGSVIFGFGRFYRVGRFGRFGRFINSPWVLGADILRVWVFGHAGPLGGASRELLLFFGFGRFVSFGRFGRFINSTRLLGADFLRVCAFGPAGAVGGASRELPLFLVLVDFWFC